MENPTRICGEREFSEEAFIHLITHLPAISDTYLRDPIILNYDPRRWQSHVATPQHTLQLFITSRCNLRCPECFYKDNLGKTEMSFEDYCRYIYARPSSVQKIVLLGGEPTLHPRLNDMIRHNAHLGLSTTVYTNGTCLNALCDVMHDPSLSGMVSVRVGVHGLTISNKALCTISIPSFPITVVYMLTNYNKKELLSAAYWAEDNLPCSQFFISSIREIDKTGNYWNDTPGTIPIPHYAAIVQAFVECYRGGLDALHISTRGVLQTPYCDYTTVRTCRFGSILHDGSVIVCPLDISLHCTHLPLIFGYHLCRQHTHCVLQKIILMHV